MAEGYLSKPIYLQLPDSFTHQEKYDHDGMEVAQHLSPEQYMYEFPRKSYLTTLEQQDEHFDECSSVSCEDDIVADHRLSPLQLPQAQIDYRHQLLDKIHWDEIFFVFPDYDHQRVHPSIHPFDRRTSSIISTTFYEDDKSRVSNHSKVVYIKMDKNHTFCTTDDEGYDDFDCPLIESASVFLPFLSAHEEQAAIKIQRAWRAYLTRTKPSLEERYKALEHRLEEEISTRKDLEATVKNMVTLVDKQQSVFQEHLERMRQSYQRKTDAILARLQPLEARLRHESKARVDVESMLSRVLDQLHSVKVQLRDQTEKRRAAQAQLDRANQQINKNPSTTITTRKTVIRKKQ